VWGLGAEGTTEQEKRKVAGEVNLDRSQFTKERGGGWWGPRIGKGQEKGRSFLDGEDSFKELKKNLKQRRAICCRGDFPWRGND